MSDAAPVWVVHLLTSDGFTSDGGNVVFVGDVDTQFFNQEPAWKQVAVVQYPSREAIPGPKVDQPAIVVTGAPIPSPQDAVGLANAPDWSTVPHPPTDDDPPVEILHFIRYHDPESINEMHQYTDHAADVAVPHGCRVAAWFGVDGKLTGDERRWDQARFNNFPSKAAFMAVALDPKRLEAQKDHREVAIADTYTMILRPSVDRIAESVGDYRVTA